MKIQQLMRIAINSIIIDEEPENVYIRVNENNWTRATDIKEYAVDEEKRKNLEVAYQKYINVNINIPLVER